MSLLLLASSARASNWPGKDEIEVNSVPQNLEIWVRPSGGQQPYRDTGQRTQARIRVEEPLRAYDVEVRGRADFFHLYRASVQNVATMSRVTLPAVREPDWGRLAGAVGLLTGGLLLGLVLALKRRQARARTLEQEVVEAHRRILRAESRSGDPTRIGPYEVVERLGQGGNARVFRVRDSFGDEYALKLPERPSPRFLREWQILKELRHAGIVRLFDFHPGDEDTPAYLALELIEGQSLAQRMTLSRPLPLPEGVRILRQMLEILEYAHAHGVVHRDLSPSNVILSGDQARLLDFGLARQEQLNTITAPDQTMGTPAYAAPEQTDGHEADARSDLFGLGVIAYEMLTGQLPWKERDPVRLFLAKSNTLPTPPHQCNPRIPAALSQLLMQMLAADPGARPASARQVLERLGDAL